MSDSPPAEASGARKQCCRCGKDLTGRTRYKTHEGYWCKSCNAEYEFRKSRLHEKGRSGNGSTIALVSGGLGLAVVAVLVYLWLR